MHSPGSCCDELSILAPRVFLAQSTDHVSILKESHLLCSPWEAISFWMISNSYQDDQYCGCGVVMREGQYH